jgi:hypothetical protein
MAFQEAEKSAMRDFHAKRIASKIGVSDFNTLRSLSLKTWLENGLFKNVQVVFLEGRRRKCLKIGGGFPNLHKSLITRLYTPFHVFTRLGQFGGRDSTV